MGFRTGAWMKVWEIQPVSAAVTKIKGQISKKNRETNEYESEFSEYCSCLGAVAQKAAALKVGDTIHLKDIDVTTFWDKVKQQKYINYKIFDFDMDSTPKANTPARTNNQSELDIAYEGVSDDVEEGLPF